MFDVVGTTTASVAAELTLDLDALTKRVARLLRRDDIDEEIQQWLNFAQRELCNAIDFPELRTTQSIALVDGTASYVLNTNFMRADKAYYKDTTLAAANQWGRELIAIPREWYNDASIERRINTGSPSKGDPSHYIIDNANIIFYLVPNKAANVTLTYYKLPTDLTSGAQQPDINSRYRHYLIWLAYFWGQVFLEKQDANKIVLWERKMRNTINDVKRVVERRENRDRLILMPPTGTEGASRIY